MTRPLSTTPRTPSTVAAVAALGAGAIHASVVGTFGADPVARATFVAVAVLQLAWGALAIIRPRRPVLAVGAVASYVLFAGWVLARVGGMSYVEGVDDTDSVQLASALAAGLTLLSGIAAALPFVGATRARSVPLRAGVSAAVVAFVVAGAAIVGMVNAADGPGDRSTHAHTGDAHAGDASRGAGHEPFDPAQPIDLGGLRGVTSEQQARAENLVAVTLDRLPRYGNPETAMAEGYLPIDGGLTKHVHYLNWQYVNDERVLDPDAPEALVYRVGRAAPTLVAAMFVLPEGSTMRDVPEVGGALMRWHVHDDLCFTPDPLAGRLMGAVRPSQPCMPGGTKRMATPMIHVWVVAHECGPFAELEDGDTRRGAGSGATCAHSH
jgi:hypothetical protein